MAKKKSPRFEVTEKPIDPSKLSERDKKTLSSLRSLAKTVVDSAEKTKAPHLDVPSRSLSNVNYNRSKRYIEMGKGSNRRELFNLSQAKSYMQTLLVASKCKSLIEVGKTASIRQVFYMCKHTIDGTSEETFDTQDESDPILEDLEVSLDALREELHVYAKSAGSIVGNLVINDSGDVIDCSRLGSGGYTVPSIVESDVIRFQKCEAKFIMFVEKDSVWRRFNEDKFWQKHKCLLIHGGGQPPRGVRRLVNRLTNELKLPVYCLLDNDPWGYYIYSVIKQGSINLAYESRRMAIPDCKFVGVRSKDFEEYELPKSVQIKLNEQDVKRAKQIAAYPWFEHKKEWQKEIQNLLSNGFKMEVEAMAAKTLSFVTEEYVPKKLRDGDFLD